MSYIDLLNEFNRWLESNALSASAQLLYFKLLNVFNRAGWPDSVRIDNLRIMSMISLSSPNAVNDARKQLVAAGLIEYEQGKKGCPGRYSLRIPYDYHKVCDKVSDKVYCNHIKNKTKEKEEEVEKAFAAPAPSFSSPSVDIGFSGLIAKYNLSDALPTKQALFEDMQKVGQPRLISALEQAAQSNSRDRVSVNYYRKFLYENAETHNDDPYAGLPWD